MSKRWYLIGLSIAAAILIAVSLAGGWALMNRDAGVITGLMFATAMPFAAVAWFAFRYEPTLDAPTVRRATCIILAAAAAMRVVLLAWLPTSSTEIYRYVWDGRVQANGINLYRYVPADPALAALRDKDVSYAPTIYPPAAQIVFRAVAAVGGGLTFLPLWSFINLTSAAPLLPKKLIYNLRIYVPFLSILAIGALVRRFREPRGDASYAR